MAKSQTTQQRERRAAASKSTSSKTSSKKTAKKKAAKRTTAKRTTVGKRPARATSTKAELSSDRLAKLPKEELAKRVQEIYRLEKAVERDRNLYKTAKAGERAAKKKLEASEAALEKEIQDQRFGPGPLFSTV